MQREIEKKLLKKIRKCGIIKGAKNKEYGGSSVNMGVKDDVLPGR